MKIVGMIPVRMESTRLPNKAIKDICGYQTSSDRLTEVASKIEAKIIVNVHGDEALVNPIHIDQSIQGLINSDAQVSILLTKFSKKNSQGDIKAVVNLKNEIMYISRNDLPSDARVEVKEMLKAYHVVSFRKDFLIKYANLEQTPLEKIEYNEYLRILENGYKIQGVMVDSDSISVDTKDDLEYVIEIMKNDALYKKYKF